MEAELDISPLEAIRAAQNPDGGWPYRKGGSWTEPTVYALLAHQAGRSAAPRAADAIAWLSGGQRPDGGWSRAAPWTRAPGLRRWWRYCLRKRLGAERHVRRRSVADRSRQGRNRRLSFAGAIWLLSGKMPDGPEFSGWPWFPGTRGMGDADVLGILALKKCYWRAAFSGSAATHRARRKRFCSRGAAPMAAGITARRGRSATTRILIRRPPARRCWRWRVQSAATAGAQLRSWRSVSCRSAGPRREPHWLRLGLLAHQQLPAGAPALTMPCRTVAGHGA